MLTWWQLVIFYSYGLPLFVINLMTVFMLLIKQDQFQTSYYRCFFICADCLLYLANNIEIRLPSFEPLYRVFYSKFSEFSYYPTIPMFIVLFCSYFTNFGTFLLSLNRLTAVWKYWSHERIWRKAGPWLIGASLLGSFIITFQTLGNQYLYTTMEINNVTAVYLKSNNAFVVWQVRWMSSAVVGTFTFLGLVVNVITFIMWQKRKSIIPAKHHEIEKSLIFLTSVIYSLHLMSFVYNTFQDKILSDRTQSWIAYNIVSDCISLIPTFSMIIASQSLRSEIFPSCSGGYIVGPQNNKQINSMMTVTVMTHVRG